jgi:hypothetical protein
VGALRFSLWLPEGYLYDDFGGSLEEVRGFKDPWSPEGTVSQAMQHLSPKPAAPLAPPPPPAPPTPAAAPAARLAMPVTMGPPGAGGAAAPSPAPKMPMPAAELPHPQAQQRVGAAKLGKRKALERESEEARADEDLALDANLPSEPEPVFDEAFEPPRDLGVLPVRMQVPEKGLCFAFERLLVLDEPLFVETEYAKEKVAR